MNTREFLKVLPAIVFSPFLFKEFLAKKNHLIVLGSAATRIIANQGSDLKVDSITFINDSEPENLAIPYKFISYCPPESAYMLLGGRKFLKNEPFPEIMLSEAVIKHLNKLKGKLIVFAALGSYTGTTHFQAMSKYVIKKGMEAKFVCSLPFEFEGSKRMKDAKLCSDFSGNLCDLQIFPHERIRKLYGNLCIRSAYAKADIEMMRMISKILELDKVYLNKYHI